MPRKRREESPNGVYHWITRGINKKNLFHDAKDYEHFRGLLMEYKAAWFIAIYHYCFMSNHAHILLRTDVLENLSKFSHFVQRRYAYYYCKKYRWVGSVFQRGFRSMAVKHSEHLLECGRYIERNPLKAMIVQAPEKYQHTSYHYYVFGAGDNLITPSPAYLGISGSLEERCRLYASYVKENRIQEEMREKRLLPDFAMTD